MVVVVEAAEAVRHRRATCALIALAREGGWEMGVEEGVPPSPTPASIHTRTCTWGCDGIHSGRHSGVSPGKCRVIPGLR